jgi:alanyl-tRNA synthetase
LSGLIWTRAGRFRYAGPQVLGGLVRGSGFAQRLPCSFRQRVDHEQRKRNPVGVSRLFREERHEVVASSPLVPRNDPTLMFTNAGMVQFKNVFTGLETRPIRRAARRRNACAPAASTMISTMSATPRAITPSSRCSAIFVRRLFQGARDRACLEPDHQGIRHQQERLLVTVYHTDDEAFDLWRKIAGLPDEKIIRIPTIDNFWAMGDTGPCGPCSEIFYDHGDHIWGGPPGSPDEDGDRFIEIWNLVFMQYEQVDDRRAGRPAAAVDRHRHGAGADCGLLQGSTTITTSTCSATDRGLRKIHGRSGGGEQAASHRVIADHLRSTSF